MSKIAADFNGTEQTVREAVHRWQKNRLGGLWDSVLRGGKPRWTQEDIEYIEQSLKAEPRTYNSYQLTQKLATERNVKITFSAKK